MMKTSFGALIGAILLCASAQAAGVNKIVRATINETQLQGYTASPPPGWTQRIIYVAANPASNPVQNAVALVYQTSSNATTPPSPFGISTISLANGAILSKENLPGPLQITRADCNIPNGLATRCPSLSIVSIFADAALPSRLIVETVKETFSAGVFGIRSTVYVFDPAALPGGGSRWTPIQTSQGKLDELPARLQPRRQAGPELLRLQPHCADNNAGGADRQ